MKQSKLILSASVFVTATLFRIFDVIDQETWFQTVTIVLGIYAGANVGATIAHRRGNGKSGS